MMCCEFLGLLSTGVLLLLPALSFSKAAMVACSSLAPRLALEEWRSGATSALSQALFSLSAARRASRAVPDFKDFKTRYTISVSQSTKVLS